MPTRNNLPVCKLACTAHIPTHSCPLFTRITRSNGDYAEGPSDSEVVLKVHVMVRLAVQVPVARFRRILHTLTLRAITVARRDSWHRESGDLISRCCASPHMQSVPCVIYAGRQLPGVFHSCSRYCFMTRCTLVKECNCTPFCRMIDTRGISRDSRFHIKNSLPPSSCGFIVIP
jgi:hypothetical protein